MEKIIKQNGKRYKLVEIIEEKKETHKVMCNGWDVTEYEKWYDEDYCLGEVKENGHMLQFVKNQTDEICLEAVKQQGNALKFVKNQTPKICEIAVKGDWRALRYVDKRLFK